MADVYKRQEYHQDGSPEDCRYRKDAHIQGYGTYLCDCDFNFAILMLLFVSEVGRNLTPQAVVPVQRCV